MALERGSILNNRYRIVEILGQGGMGSIYRAIDENLGVNVAVKENLFTTEEYARQFRREAIILASLRHPNLPRVTDHFVIEGQGQYLVMDYVEGEDLRERMDREGVLPDSEVVIVGTAICDALSYLHSRQPQVVHRDIKPGNVKITPGGQIILVDFGLAKVIQGSEATTTGARAMTPGYSPPEQYGTARTDQRTDLYSLGATLYVALTGALPEDALARAMEQTDLTPVRKHNPKVSKRLAAVIEKALELRPDDRYQTADDFKQALLNSRVVTGRRDRRDLTVTPPPAAPSEEPAPLAARSPVSPPVAGDPWPSGQLSPAAALFAPSSGSPLLPVSTPLDQPVQMPPLRRRRKRSLGFPFFAVLILGVLVLGGLGAYRYQPNLISDASALLASILPPAAAPAGTSTPTPESSQPVVIPPPTGTATPTEAAAVTATPTEAPTSTPTLVATPLPTPLGGGSGEIAYASQVTGVAQIWMMNADGTAQQQITDMPEGACQPAWSPDGLRLVFISPCASNQEIYPGASLFIINADGTNLVPLPSLPGGDFDPAWSPDGSQIVFTSLRDFNRAQIYVINLEDNSFQSISNNTVRDAQPSWSPDGEKIVFISTRRGPSQIWTMNRDGSNPEIFSRSGSLKNSHPVWSPDGQVIVYTQSEPLGGVPRLMAARFEDKAFTENRIVKDVTPMREAGYSPDGYWLVFESWPDGTNHDIVLMTANGQGRQRLTNDPSLDFDAAWRPPVTQP
jgi:serine/threonine protein kinase